ncbi:MAG: hypothetical protein A2W30_07360 [Ignavibacteria bacterium RBG_16_36_9]|nr:MAG: hypothetical protein A2W30_07360 [Ignavibacteria bacterium RBG_16_36_9]
MKQLFENRIIYRTIIALISFYVLIAFVKLPPINGYKPAMFSEMVDGTAWKPFVYRTLLPTTVRLISEVVPIEIHNTFTTKVESSFFLTQVLEKFKWESEFITEYLVAMVLMYLTLLGFVFAFRKLFDAIYSSPLWFKNIISIILLLAIPAMFQPQYSNYIYDFSSLFLFTLGLLLLRQKKWRYFLILFFISCFNKETVILLTMIFAIHFYKDAEISRKLYYQLIAAQLMIFAAIKILLYILFMNNPGGFVEFHLIDRNYLLFNGYSLTTFIVLLIIFLSIFSKWNEKPKFLKDALWIAVPLLILTLFLGFFDELRDYYEVFPIVVLLISFNIAKILGVEIADKAKTG